MSVVIISLILLLLASDIDLAKVKGHVKVPPTSQTSDQANELKSIENSDFFENLFLNILPEAIGSAPCNGNGSFGKYKELALNDISNAEIGNYSPQMIIERSGYKQETHHVVSEDGYITQAVRIINPLVNPMDLKQPPVMVMHGGITNMKTWLFASSIQHHPEIYPRSHRHGPITSYNRSLAFVLANNGYDVWLMGTRGSEFGDRMRMPLPKVPAMTDKDAKLPKKLLEMGISNYYWHYSMDDIIKYEFPKQIEKVLQITGAKKVSLMTYSFSTILSFGLLVSSPKLAEEKVHNLVIMAPLLNTVGMNKVFFSIIKLLAQVPLNEAIGTMFITRTLLSEPVRRLITLVGKIFKKFTYTVIKFVLSILVGCSGQYRTFLEAGVLDNVLEATSFVQIKHYAQILLAGRLQKYDYGDGMNMGVYGQSKPPAYDISNIHVANWMMITAGNDNLGTPDSSDRILEIVHPKPNRHVVIPGYSHLDLVAGFDNGPLINLNIVNFFDEFVF